MEDEEDEEDEEEDEIDEEDIDVRTNLFLSKLGAKIEPELRLNIRIPISQ